MAAWPSRCRSTSPQVLAAKAHSAIVTVAMTSALVPPTRRPICREARKPATSVLCRVRRAHRRATSCSSRPPMTATATAASPGASSASPSSPSSPSRVRTCQSAATVAVTTTASARTMRRTAVAGVARCSCASTGCASVRRSPSAAAVTEPAIAISSPATRAESGRRTIGPGSSAPAAACTTPKASKTPSGTAAVTTASGSSNPSAATFDARRPRSLASATSCERPSAERRGQQEQHVPDQQHQLQTEHVRRQPYRLALVPDASQGLQRRVRHVHRPRVGAVLDLPARQLALHRVDDVGARSGGHVPAGGFRGHGGRRQSFQQRLRPEGCLGARRDRVPGGHPGGGGVEQVGPGPACAAPVRGTVDADDPQLGGERVAGPGLLRLGGQRRQRHGPADRGAQQLDGAHRERDLVVTFRAAPDGHGQPLAAAADPRQRGKNPRLGPAALGRDGHAQPVRCREGDPGRAERAVQQRSELGAVLHRVDGQRRDRPAEREVVAVGLQGERHLGRWGVHHRALQQRVLSGVRPERPDGGCREGRHRREEEPERRPSPPGQGCKRDREKRPHGHGHADDGIRP